MVELNWSRNIVLSQQFDQSLISAWGNFWREDDFYDLQELLVAHDSRRLKKTSIYFFRRRWPSRCNTNQIYVGRQTWPLRLLIEWRVSRRGRACRPTYIWFVWHREGRRRRKKYMVVAFSRPVASRERLTTPAGHKNHLRMHTQESNSAENRSRQKLPQALIKDPHKSCDGVRLFLTVRLPPNSAYKNVQLIYVKFVNTFFSHYDNSSTGIRKF